MLMKPFKEHTLRGLMIQMQNISFWSWGMHRKHNFKIVLGFKSDRTVLTFTFHFLSFPFFSFSCPIFYSFFLLVDFILVGKVLRKAFRILGLDEMKGRWVVEQHFHGNVQGNFTWLFWFFSLVSSTELCSF